MATPTAEEIAIVRTLIPDTEAVFGAGEDETMFSDTEIGYFMAAGRGNVLRAAGLANLSIASSEALISKKIQTQDLKTDGAAIADALTKKANALFARADKDDEQDGFDFFEIVDYQEGWGPARPELTEWNWAV